MSEAGPKEASGAQIIQWSGLSDVGRFRKNNQDAFLALALNGEGVRRLGKYGEAELNESDHIFAVSDGMGGERTRANSPARSRWRKSHSCCRSPSAQRRMASRSVIKICSESFLIKYTANLLNWGKLTRSSAVWEPRSVCVGCAQLGSTSRMLATAASIIYPRLEVSSSLATTTPMLAGSSAKAN